MHVELNMPARRMNVGSFKHKWERVLWYVGSFYMDGKCLRKNAI